LGRVRRTLRGESCALVRSQKNQTNSFVLDQFYSWTSGRHLEVEHVAAAGEAPMLNPRVPTEVQSMWAKLDDRWGRQRPGGGTQRGTTRVSRWW